MTDGVTRGTAHTTLLNRDSLPQWIVLQHPRPRPTQRLTLDLFTGNRPENCGDVSNPRVHPEIGEPDFMVEYWDYDHWQPVEKLTLSRQHRALQQQLTLDFAPVESDKFRLVLETGYRYGACVHQ